MTLEDFFTLTEMKDGLTTLPRVNELVTVMQKENDSAVKNIGEAAKQWSTVATTIAATDNRQCLDHFIQLDGLHLIDRWLKDAQECSSISGYDSVEESILTILRALEKLQIDNERSISSGILITVKNLLGHNNSKIQDKARALVDGWEVTQETDAISQVFRKIEVLHDAGTENSINRDRDSGQCLSLDKSSSHSDNIEEKLVKPSEDEILPLNLTAASQLDSVDEEQITSPDKAICDAITENELQIPGSSDLSNHGNDSLPANEEASVHHSRGTDDAKQMQGTDSENVGGVESSIVSVPLKQGTLSSGADVATTSMSGLEPDMTKEIDASNQGYHSKNSSSSESRNVSREDDLMDDKVSANHRESMLMLDAKAQVEECNKLGESSGDDCRWGEAKDTNKAFSGIENSEVAEKSEEHSGSEDRDDSENDADSFKPSTSVKDCSVMTKRSDMELDYGMVDPLEVARQVALEVEREIDCREPSCSSSDKTSDCGLRQPNSPDSTNRKQSKSIEGPCKKFPTLANLSSRALPTGVDPGINTKTLGVDHENCIYDIASSQVTEAAQESEANMGKGFSGFDLNQEVCSEDMDMPLNQISTPIPVASSSRVAAASGMPPAPLQFEGTLGGWKGSAATSAFRRIPEGDGSRHNSRQRLDSLDFDLNVVEGGEGGNEDLLSGKQIPIFSGFPSGEESSIEAASPRRSERLKLDLNHAGDGGFDALLDWRRDGRLFQNQNVRQSPSQSSSSSSMHPSSRNIDLNLNDQPLSVQDSSLDHRYLGKPFQNLNASETASDSSVIIFGARLDVKRKDSVTQTPPLPYGRTVDHQMDLNLGRSGGIMGMGPSNPYTHPPVYGFNSFASGSGMPSYPALYGQAGGPMSYMVDSRGAPVLPQFMASAQSHPNSFSQATPFMMSSNGAGPSQHNFDLNSGLRIEEGNKETGVALRQFLNPGQGRSLDDHLRAPRSSGLGLKRQEPDSGWEPYPFNFKHHQPSWK